MHTIFLQSQSIHKLFVLTKGAFFWGYSSYSYSGLGLTEYTEFLFRKERSKFWKRNTHGGGDLGNTIPARRDWRERPRRISRQKFPKRTRILCIPSKPYSFHSVHSAIGSRMNAVHSENGIAPKRTQIPSILSIPIPE